jgi:hypothetical protein
MQMSDYKRNDTYQTLFVLDGIKNTVLKQHVVKDNSVLLIKTKSTYNLLRLTI